LSNIYYAFEKILALLQSRLINEKCRKFDKYYYRHIAV
jgi:hypothetical protein